MYVPRFPPQNPADLSGFIGQETQNIAKAMRDPGEFLLMQILNKPPQRVANGMIVMADGVNWNPGSGAGLYRYQGNAWNFVG